LRKAGRGGVTIGADWDRTPTQILLFATSNWHRSFKRLGSAPIHTQPILAAARIYVLGAAEQVADTFRSPTGFQPMWSALRLG
jgi:hypothetical protein